MLGSLAPRLRLRRALRCAHHLFRLALNQEIIPTYLNQNNPALTSSPVNPWHSKIHPRPLKSLEPIRNLVVPQPDSRLPLHPGAQSEPFVSIVGHCSFSKSSLMRRSSSCARPGDCRRCRSSCKSSSAICWLVIDCAHPDKGRSCRAKRLRLPESVRPQSSCRPCRACSPCDQAAIE